MTDLIEKRLKIVFKEIISGKTKVIDDVITKKDLYISHHGDYSSSLLDEHYFKFYEKAIQEGLPTVEEKTKYLIQENLWKHEDDQKIKYYEEKLEKLKEIKDQTYLMSQLEKIKKDIAQLSVDLNILKEKKQELLGYTVEKYAENKMEYYYILDSYFLDENLTQKIFDEKNNDIETFGQYNYYIRLHNKAIEKFNIKNIKRLAISNYVQNLISLSQRNCYHFYGKPIYSLTYYQSSLYSYGLFYERISSSSEYAKLSPEIKNDPDKLIEYYSATSNLKKKIENNKEVKGPAFVMDATEKDLEFLNQNKTTYSQNSLDALAKEKGGTLNLQDLAKFYNKK